jgi:hypothetical protein
MSTAAVVSDGVVLDYGAIGLRVRARADSAWGHYKAGDLGVIVGLNATDPVVRWDAGGLELQTSRHKLLAANPVPIPVVKK